MKHKKIYLGDGVYAEMTDLGLELTTEDGVRITNRIVLEPEVYTALLAFVEAWRK